MKKTLFLLTLMLCVFGSSGAADIILFSADVISTGNVSFEPGETPITSAMATITGGTMTVINQQSDAKNLIATQSNSVGFCFTNNNTFFKIELGKALQEGDVFSAKCVCAKDGSERGIWVSTADSRPSTCDAKLTCSGETSAKWVSLNNYTITSESDLLGATTIYLYRHTGNSTYFDEFTITRSGVELVTATLSYSSESATATLGETFTPPTLTVDPTGAASEVTYSSSKPEVATVDATGAVTLLSGGKTTITASIQGSTTYTNASASYTLTVIDPNVTTVTAIWPFDTGGEGQCANINPEGVFSIDAVEIAGVTYSGVGSYTNCIGTKVKSPAKVSDNKSHYVKFILTPKKGINFYPTSISFDAMRWGTNGGYIHYYIESGSSSLELGEVNPNRNTDNNEWSHISHDVTGITCTKDAPFVLACYIYNLDSGKEVSFANVTVTGTFDGTAEDETMYTITTSVNPEGAGTVSQSPAGASLTEGTKVTFTANANTGYRFLNKWMVNGTEVQGETYTIESLSANTEVVAKFKKLYAISFSAGDGDKGTTPHALTTEYAEETYTTPEANYYVSKEGYTATGWTDGETTYGFSEEITLTGDITLSPVFEANTVSLTETARTDDLVVTWDFTGTPVLNIEKATGYYVNQAYINDALLDIPMYINNATTGKTNNATRDNDTQVNAGSSFTIPAMKGMTVVLNAKSSISSTTVGGNAPVSGSGTGSATYVYEGDDATVEISIQDGSYYTSIVVTYPPTASDYTFNVSDLRWVSFYDSKTAYYIPENMTAYYVESAEGNKLNLMELEGNVIPADFGVLLEGDEGTHTLSPTPETADKPENLLRGSDTEEMTKGDNDEATYRFYALSAKNGAVGFYWMNNTGSAFKNGSHKAYLAVEQTTTTGNVNAYLLDGTDGIMQAITTEKAANTPAYNIAGQQVSATYKGIVIVNGAKVLRK